MMNQHFCPPSPPSNGSGFDEWQQWMEQVRETIETQNRTIRYLLTNYNDLLNKVESECGAGGPCPPPSCVPGGDNGMFTPGKPWYLWGGPYPLEVSATSPANVKVWFDTTSGQLLIWNWQPQQWLPATATVKVSSSPPPTHPIGTLWVDQDTNKMWVSIDDWRELTAGVPGPAPIDGAPIVTALMPPSTPGTGTLWFEPTMQGLFIWNSIQWVRIGSRVQRNVRNGNYIHSWNAGGNRAQAIMAGDIFWVAGIRGIDPATQLQVPGCGPRNTQGTVAPNTQPNANLRIDQIYTNIQTIVQAEGLSLFDCLMIHTSLASNAYISPTAGQQALPQFWDMGPYPNRTHETWLGMSGSDPEQEYGDSVPGWPARGDVVECTTTFYVNRFGSRTPSDMASEIKAIPGVKTGFGLPPAMQPPAEPQPSARPAPAPEVLQTPAEPDEPDEPPRRRKR